MKSRTTRGARALFAMAALVVASLAAAHGPTRQKVTETVDLDAPPAEVWAVIGDFQGAADWLPMVESSSGEGGNEKGATRTLELGDGKRLIETLKKHDDAKMSYSYRISDKTLDVAVLPVNNYSSTLSVKARDSGSTVTWKGAFYRGYPNNDPPPELNDDAAVAAVGAIYRAGLGNLKSMLESK